MSVNGDDLKKYIVGVAVASTMTLLSTLFIMWRDIAIIKAELEHLQQAHTYYHGDYKPPAPEGER